MERNHYDIVIIGAGASGLIAGGKASENGASVLVLEKMEKVGRKLFITGKGRCNVTNSDPLGDFIKHIYPDGRVLRQVFGQFFSDHIIQLLKSQKVDVTIERGGRVFPVSNKSSDVVKALTLFAQKNGAEIALHSKAERLLITNNTVEGIEWSNNGKLNHISCKKIIICTGGCSYPATGSDGDGYKLAEQAGHKLVIVHPALTGIDIQPVIPEGLPGLSPKNVLATVWSNGKKIRDSFGEMLFTHQGISGPIVLSLSRFAISEFLLGKDVEISIDWKPALDEEKLNQKLIRDLNENGKKLLVNIFKLWLPGQVIPWFLQRVEIDCQKECHQVNSKERRRILLMMKDFRLKMSGYRPFKEAIITAGGVSTSEIDMKTMQSRKVNGLYFAGEVIDLDADTGGYNLQIAFSTGWVAANHAMNSLQ